MVNLALRTGEETVTTIESSMEEKIGDDMQEFKDQTKAAEKSDNDVKR